MKKVTEVLRHEHRLIARAAACLDRVADEALDTDDLRIVSALQLLEFFEEFADAAHQEKEERHLYPALLRAGVSRSRMTELAVDHARGRSTLGELREQLEGAAYGDPISRDRFVSSAMRYARQEREHAAEEDEILLPLVDELLSAAQERSILHDFKAVENELLPHPPEYYARLVEDVAGALGSNVWDDGCLTLEVAV